MNARRGRREEPMKFEAHKRAREFLVSGGASSILQMTTKRTQEEPESRGADPGKP